MKHDIFISYSRRDKDVVDDIVDFLKRNGYTVWIDVTGIESGEAFRGIIVEAIESSGIVIFFSSEASNLSAWTTKEISLAVDSRIFIIPIKLDKVKYNKNIRFDLIDLDYIDMSEQRFYEDSKKKLLRTVRSKLGERQISDTDSGEETTGETSKIIDSDKHEFKGGNSLKSNRKFFESKRNIFGLIICGFLFILFIGLFFGNSFRSDKESQEYVNEMSDSSNDNFDWLSTREVTPMDLEHKSTEQLRIMRNWIYARHGYIFKSGDLTDYFSKFSWYNPTSKDVTSQLNKIEKTNIRLIQRYEESLPQY